jgi:undecaprenyl-diphosphatase
LFLGLAITGVIRASYSRYDRVPLSPDPFTWAALGLWLAFTAVYMASHWDGAVLAYSPQPVTP